MRVTMSPTKQIREKLQLTQTQFAITIGVSKGHMSEVEAGIAPLSGKIKDFLEALCVNVEEIEKKHEVYMEHKRQLYRAEAAQVVQAGTHH